MRPEIICVFLRWLWKTGMVWSAKMVECGCGWPAVRTMMMIVMLKMRVPVLADLCMIFHRSFRCFWNVTFWTICDWKNTVFERMWVKIICVLLLWRSKTSKRLKREWCAPLSSTQPVSKSGSRKSDAQPWNRWFHQLLHGKTYGLRESMLNSYVFYCVDVQK